MGTETEDGGARGVLGLWILFVMALSACMGGDTSSQTLVMTPVLVRARAVFAIANAHRCRTDVSPLFADAAG
jgi:hypothetical protein